LHDSHVFTLDRAAVSTWPWCGCRSAWWRPGPRA